MPLPLLMKGLKKPVLVYCLDVYVGLNKSCLIPFALCLLNGISFQSSLRPEALRANLFIQTTKYIFLYKASMPRRGEYNTILQGSRVRVSAKKRRKKRACPARVAEAGQENIETVHEPKPIQAADTL